MEQKAIILFVVRNGDKLEKKYYAWSDEKKDVFHSDNREDALVMDMYKAEDKIEILWRNKDNAYPIVIPVADEAE